MSMNGHKTAGPTRILMYSHDGGGLGHFRRLLKLSTFLREVYPEVSILIITGSSMAHGFEIPDGVDYLKLPCVCKDFNQEYISKYLSLPFKEIKSIREKILLETALAFRPDLFLIDYDPIGIRGEVLPAIKALKDLGRRTKIVLGIRDILHDPPAVRAHYGTEPVKDALENIYDEIWVYGCQSLFDPIKEYQFTEKIAAKVKFCGYLPCAIPSTSSEEIREELGVGGSKFIFATVGGGDDGFPLLDNFLKSLEFLPKDMDVFSLLLTGPDMPSQKREELARRCKKFNLISSSRVKLMKFSSRAIEYMHAADVVVSMGGYNTLSEILTLEKNAVVVPRFWGRGEQMIRATEFEKRELIRTLRPNQFSPQILAENILSFMEPPHLSFKQRLDAAKINLDGFESVKNHLIKLLNSRRKGRQVVLTP